MAEQIIFGADIDNVTIKNINGKLTAVIDVENTADEFEVVTDYVEPQEDDDYYVESVFAKFRHKATQLLTDAFKKEKKPRSAPMNESLTEPLTAEIHEERGVITLLATGNPVSQVDGKSLAYSDYNPANTYVKVNKSDYANAKAFNTANAGKTFTVTTKKRYAESEGHPVVRETEFSVAYPELPYRDGELKLALDISSLDGNFGFGVQEASLPKFVEDALTSNAFRNTQVEVEYTIDKGDGNPVTGTATTTAYQIGKNFLREIGHEQSGAVQWTVTYKVKPFNFTWFEGNVTITSDAATQKVGDSIEGVIYENPKMAIRS